MKKTGMNNILPDAENTEKLKAALAVSQRREQEFSALLEASRAVLEQSDFKLTARRIFDSCKELTGATAGYVALLNKEGTENLVLFLDSGGLDCTVDPSLPMPVRGLRAEAYGPPATVYENNFPSSPWAKLLPDGHVQLENALFAPLTIHGKAVGVMGVANKPGGFNEDDARIASAFGEIAAISLSNSWALDKLAASDTEINKLNENLDRHATELEAANKELEAFSYTVSHDLRSPLRTINELVHDLLDHHGARLDDEGRHLLGAVSENTRKMELLVDDVLSFSRAGRMEISAIRIDMENLARVALDDLQLVTEGRNLEVEFKPLPAARGDLHLLRQVWTSLLDNAIKFTRSKPVARIEVGGEAKGKELVYHVKDNGAGFDMRYAGKLFEAFQRLHSYHEFEGTGVGLAIVKRIISRHGGRVWAEGKVNEGAAVYFTLPVLEE